MHFLCYINYGYLVICLLFSTLYISGAIVAISERKRYQREIPRHFDVPFKTKNKKNRKNVYEVYTYAIGIGIENRDPKRREPSSNE